ncbi:MAG: peroxiredoxin [Pseudomonadota bacterium]|nr:peroxiredoxin [Pseudomonadota bacterium]MEC8977425.1 peroxiredoxin [Pseudomonadota bacterium]
MMQVTNIAPDFTVPAVSAEGEILDAFNLYEEIEGQYALLFFYPLDFTFVCPTEMIALDKRMAAFTEKNTKVIAISVDSAFSHNQWRKTPVNQGGIGAVNYTMAADVAHHICRAYGVEHPQEGVALRASIIIDPAKQIRVKMVNDLPVGRNIDELVRLVGALQFVDTHGEVCPAGWQHGDDGFKADPEGISSYLEEHAESL